jgi:hypothetical protein
MCTHSQVEVKTKPIKVAYSIGTNCAAMEGLFLLNHSRPVCNAMCAMRRSRRQGGQEGQS